MVQPLHNEEAQRGVTTHMKKLAKTIAPIALVALVGCVGNGGISDGQNIDPGTDPGTDPTPTPTPTTGRVTNGLVALYTFKEGMGTLVTDQSGGGYNLSILNPENVEWMAGGGLEILQPTAIINQDAGGQPAGAIGIISACKASNAITVETWARTNDVGANGPARVVTLSTNANNRNFTLGQENTLVDARLRTTLTNTNGTPATASQNDVWDGQINHVVYTRKLGDASVWLNGNIAGQYITIEGEEQTPLLGDFSNWNDTYPLTLANEPTLDRPWTGQLFLVAVYCRDLNAIEITQNMQAGY